MKALFSIALLAVCCSWQQAQKARPKQMAWLRGTWEQKTTRGPVYESWTQLSETEFFGKSFVLKGRDTVLLESIRIVSEQGSWYYIPTVAGQNRGLPVRFTAVTISENVLIFENSAHDFPQQITYTHAGPDSLLAEISGSRDGKIRRQLFPMKRIQD